jgi:hypothetical protein
MPVARDSPSIQGDVPGPDPARAPPSKAIAMAGLACPGKVRQAERRCPASARAWSRFCPHAIGAERFVAVSSGTSFAQVEGAILGKRACGQNPDKDEVPRFEARLRAAHA